MSANAEAKNDKLIAQGAYEALCRVSIGVVLDPVFSPEMLEVLYREKRMQMTFLHHPRVQSEEATVLPHGDVEVKLTYQQRRAQLFDAVQVPTETACSEFTATCRVWDVDEWAVGWGSQYNEYRDLQLRFYVLPDGSATFTVL